MVGSWYKEWYCMILCVTFKLFEYAQCAMSYHGDTTMGSMIIYPGCAGDAARLLRARLLASWWAQQRNSWTWTVRSLPPQSTSVCLSAKQTLPYFMLPLHPTWSLTYESQGRALFNATKHPLIAPNTGMPSMQFTWVLHSTYIIRPWRHGIIPIALKLHAILGG